MGELTSRVNQAVNPQAEPSPAEAKQEMIVETFITCPI